jgi:hypothetical protein
MAMVVGAAVEVVGAAVVVATVGNGALVGGGEVGLRPRVTSRLSAAIPNAAPRPAGGGRRPSRVRRR